jgi:hypothetical protein
MKQRRSKRPKPQSRKQTDKSPPLDWLTPLAQRTPIGRTPNPALGTSGIVQPPLPLRESFKGEGGFRADSTVVRAAHAEMLSWIGVFERLIAELPKRRRGIGHNLQPITDEEVEATTQAVAVLKAQPVTPKAPDEARAAGSTLQKIGERLGTYLDACLLEASKEVGKRLVQLPYWLAVWYTLKHIVQSVAGWLP